MVPILAFGLKLTGDLFPGKSGIVGLTKPLIIVDRLSGFDLDAGLLILYFNYSYS